MLHAVLHAGYGYHSSGSSALVTLMLFAVVCIIAVQAFRMMRSNRSSDAYDGEGVGLV